MKQDQSWLMNREREAQQAARATVEVRQTRLGWAVFQGGRLSSPVFATREQAMTAAAARVKAVPTSRRYGK